MKKKNKNMPSLRFPEFKRHWEEKTLRELGAHIRMGNEKPGKDGLYPVYDAT